MTGREGDRRSLSLGLLDSTVSHNRTVFTNALLYNLAYPNNICNGYSTRSSCQAQTNSFTGVSACQWDPSSGSCSYVQPSSSFLVQVTTSLHGPRYTWINTQSKLTD